MPRRRLDAELVRRGLAPDVATAAAAVASGLVTVGGGPARNAAAMIAPDDAVRIARPSGRFVSRGGEKLAAALERFDVDPRERDALDAGASTGGFTDCLLQAGAARVVAVDVGYGQLAWSLRDDPRVAVRERTNVRDLTREDLPFPPSVVVADLSFVSLAGIVPHLVALAAVGADLVLLVKPQFEAAQDDVGKGGVVRDPAIRRAAIERVASAAAASGAGTLAVMVSPIAGPAGNVEFLLHARAGAVSEIEDPGAPADGEPGS